MADLLREVDEAVRADNIKKFWDENKNALIIAVAATILGTAAFSLWSNYTLQKNRAQTSQILTALDAKNPAAALVAAGAKQSGNAKAISFLNAATQELKAGNKQKALDNYIEAQKAKSSDKVFSDLATLQKTNLMLDLKPDTKADDYLKDLAPIAKNKKSPWQGEAIFMSAFIKGEKNKDFAGASSDLQTLQARDDITESIKQRAQALQSVYDLKKQETK